MPKSSYFVFVGNCTIFGTWNLKRSDYWNKHHAREGRGKLLPTARTSQATYKLQSNFQLFCTIRFTIIIYKPNYDYNLYSCFHLYFTIRIIIVIYDQIYNYNLQSTLQLYYSIRFPFIIYGLNYNSNVQVGLQI